MAGSSTLAHFGFLASSVEATLAKASIDHVVSRPWAGDHTLCKPDPTDSSNHLGWLTGAQDLLPSAREAAVQLRDPVQRDGDRDVVMLGLGDSSLRPEVLWPTMGSAKGHPRLWVLDTTFYALIPATVARRSTSWRRARPVAREATARRLRAC